MSITHRIWALLTPREHRRLLPVFIIMLVSALLEVAGIASVMPFLALVSSPETIQETEILGWLYQTLGFQSANRFLVFTGCVVLLILVFSNGIAALANWAVLRFTWMRSNALSRRLFATYLARPYSYFLTRNTSTLTRNMLGEANHVVGSVIMPVVRIVARGLLVVLIMALLVAVDPVVAFLIFLILGGAYGLIYWFLRRKLAAIGRERLDSNRERYRSCAEAFGNLKIVKLFSIEDHFVRCYGRHSFRFADSTARVAVIRMVPRYVLETVAFGGILIAVLCLLLAGRELTEMLPLLGVYALGGYRLLPALQSIFTSVASVRSGLASLEALEADLKTATDSPCDETSTRSATDAIPPLCRGVELRNVSYRYPATEEAAVREISLMIPAGASVALAGRTGSGKTTIVDLILGLLLPSAGEILVDGILLTEENVCSWRSCLGYVPQEIYLSDDTVARNIAFGSPDKAIDMEAVRQAAQIASIHDFIVSKLPAGYETPVGERGMRLSGGERQRIGIARALYRNPDVLVLDEATSALDSATEEAVYRALQEVSQSRTLIVIAHRLTTVQDCDVIYVLDGGGIVATGTYEELLASSAEFRSLAKTAGQRRKTSTDPGCGDPR